MSLRYCSPVHYKIIADTTELGNIFNHDKAVSNVNQNYTINFSGLTSALLLCYRATIHLNFALSPQRIEVLSKTDIFLLWGMFTKLMCHTQNINKKNQAGTL